ncbi:otogelin [Alosa pseudoharengus]|uniref:otogelin n=1 Tax=Alosa pseudoharengus TaxID=34774 RepID=UPI003F8C4C21
MEPAVERLAVGYDAEEERKFKRPTSAITTAPGTQRRPRHRRQHRPAADCETSGPVAAYPESSESSSIILQKWDTGSQGEQKALTSNISTTGQEALKPSIRRATGPCTFPCLNGGHCIHSDSCNCSLYQGTGRRCQKVPNTGFEREMTCRSWGQYNFETFDGLYFYYPGKCTYTLLRDCEDATQSSVLIQIHNDPDCGPSPYTCARSVSLFLPWEGEIRLQNFTVTFKGQSVQLPYNIHDIQLERISQYILVTQQHGFTLAWEGYNGSVYIKMSPEYVGRTCGLCGNFNADVQDDLKTSYGVVTEDVAMFGNSWTEEEPHQASCPMVPSLYPSPCADQDAHTRLKVEEVCATLLKSPFKSCHEFVSPYSFMASCSNDLCLSGPSGDEVCQVFTEYARACAHAGHTLHDWRSHIQACAVSCPVELVYNECITCCPVSCKVERMCIDSKLQCLDGCYCPDDLIFEDGSCVKASDCPCEFHGMLYPPGQVVQEECNNCTCLGGVWNCTDYTCPGECSVTGDMFFQSFDGRVYTFPATCQYVLAKSRNSGKFTITIQNAPCGPNLDGACIQSVNLVVDEDPRTEITMSHIGEVFVSSQYRISLPYSDEMFHIQELSTMFLQVKTSQGLRLQYNWREFRLYLQVSELWKEDTVGLCGTFNGNIQDDFLAPSGMIESTPQLFGNAWRVPSACMPSLSLPQLDPCDAHQQIAFYASQMCDVLNQALFAPCHAYLSPVPFHQQCRADTCKCGQPCLCSALAHYARHCRRFSIIIDFRAQVADCAITCPETMEYGMCVSACQRRCQFLSMPHLCGDECEEGCVCPLGTFYNTRTRSCVRRSECHCTFLGVDYAPGDEIMTSSGVQVCQDGKIMSQISFINETCPPGQRYHECNEVMGSLALSKGVACEETCESHLLNLTCSAYEPCIPGCVCPEGLLKHGDECFWPEACPCIWKGKEYFPGDLVTSPCHQCVCQHGTFQCVFQPCPSMCTAYGDRHYRTFDGLLFDYVGVCKVYLVKSSVDSMLSVSAENVDCYESGVICRKSLLITIGRSVIAFDDDSGKPSMSSVVDRRQGMYIWQAGYFTIVHIPEADVTVLWDRKTTVHIQAGPRWQGKLSGLCGNFDLRTVNEMRTPENIDSATPQEFGNSWTAAECVNSPDIRHPCSLSPLREPFAKRQCGILLSEVFHVCHPVVDVTWFYMNCLADTCGCNRGGDCECFCTSVAAYAHQCCQQGITVDWRTPSVCPYDCEYYNKVLGKGPYQLTTYRERDTVITANRTSGVVLPRRRSTAGHGLLSTFMMTPGLSRVRPHDTSLVSFEAADRPNYFLRVDRGGHLRLAKWQDSEAFFDQCTFVLHRDTWIPGYDSLESFSKPGFFLHYMVSWVHLMKYNHSDGFRRATLFRLAALSSEYQIGPRCQWRYESCVSPCFRTCSDPSGQSCVTILKVEGCLPVCPAHMVLDEVTQRCVHLEDCTKPPVAVQPITPSSTAATPAAVTSATTTTTLAPSTTRATPPSPTTTTTTTTSVPTQAPSTTTPAVETFSTTVHAPSTSTDKVVTPTTTVTAIVATGSTQPSTPKPSALPTGAFESSSATVRPVVVDSVRTTARTSAASPSTVPVVTTTETTSRTPSPSTTPESASTQKTTPASPTSLFWLTSSTARTVSTTGVTSAATSSTAMTSPHITTTSSTRATIASEPSVVTGRTTASRASSTTPTTRSPETTQSTTEHPTPSVKTTTHATETRTTVSVTETTYSPATSPTHTVASTTVKTIPESTTESATPSAAFTTVKTTPSRAPRTTQPLSSTVPTERTVQTSPTEPRTSTTVVPEPSSSTLAYTAPTRTTTMAVPASPTSEQAATTKKTTTVVAPTALSPLTTRSTRTTPPPEVPSTKTTTYRPHVEVTSTTSQPSTRRTTDWQTRPPYPETSSTPVAVTHRVTSATKTFISPFPTGEATSAKTSTAPPSPRTTTSIATSSTGSTLSTTITSATTTTTKSTTPAERVTSRIPTTTTAIPEVTTEDRLSTLSTTARKPRPSTQTTAVRPVTLHPHTDTTRVPPVTGRVEVSTTAATTSRPSPWSPVVYTTSTPATSRPSTPAERVTTRNHRIHNNTNITNNITNITNITNNTNITNITNNITNITNITNNNTNITNITNITNNNNTNITNITNNITNNNTNITNITNNITNITNNNYNAFVFHVHIARPKLTTTTTTTTTTSTEKVSTTEGTTSASTPTLAIRPTPEATSALTGKSTLGPDGVTTSTSSAPVTSTLPTALSTRATEPVRSTETSWSPVTRSTSEESSEAPETPAASGEPTTMTAPSTRMCTPPYSEMIDECTKYICVGGQLVLFNKSQSCPYNSVPPNCGLLGFAILVNGDKCCPKWDCPCRCSVFPDLNVITFDGNSVAIYKAASYVVTQLPNETVSILVQECPVSDTLLWNFTNLCLVALNITHKSHNVLINRLQRRLYVNSRYAKPRFRKHGFEILDTGNMYLIRTPTGLKIQWFHSTGMMVLETDTYNKKLPTMGLCGCCDGNPANDLTLSNGTTVGESEDPAVFIDSWQLPNTTSYVSQSRRREVNCSTSDCSQCLDMLHINSFTPCHDYVPPATFCELWVRDAEYVNNPCVALAAYVASCHKFNVCIEWRSPDYCPFHCPETLRYQACLTTCTAQSCPNHEFEYDPEQCSGLTEGCVCPEGTLLHRPYSSLCIPPSKCACTDSFGTPRAVGEVWKASKDGCCMYRCENDTIVPVEYNCTETPPLECKRAGEVVISLADDKSCCPQKACVCNQTLCDAAPPECKFGERVVSYFREDSCCPDYACECDPELCETEVPPCRDDQTLIATKADGSCCLAYICICDTCPEIIPKCEEGELLTVDANSTDRCCPAYQCVCEPFRCAEFSCPLGMAVSVDSLPGRCCPQHTCECACDKLPSLKCALGEIMQPDRSYQFDPINQCGCKRYKCVRDAVCVNGERGVMRPGQTLVEHSDQGVCSTTHCTHTLDPLSGYHLIRTTSTNCSAQCYPNQMYIPPKDLSSCCGVCRNISCLYKNENGSVTLFKPGKTWVSDCMRYECAGTQSGPTLISYSYSCPPFNETECMKIGGTIVSYMDGCCRTCKEDGKSCQKVTVRMTIRKNDCRSNRPVNIVSCDGKCPSASIYNYNINTYARFCKCCREMGLQRRTVQLYCSGNSTWVNYSIQEPTDCSCQWS